MVTNPFTGRPARIAVLGLGYVGLPVAVAFAAQHDVVGFDVDDGRIQELCLGEDRTLEVTSDVLKAATRLNFTSDSGRLADCDVFIVTVPTPIDSFKRPDLSALQAASRSVGAAMRKGSVVIYESTVYPGATEEECVPILASVSGLTFNQDFSQATVRSGPIPAIPIIGCPPSSR
jgi:UDP-N-acetyl-D-galactosamine dehydrogenase